MAKPKFKVRTVQSKEDRKRPSVFMSLKTDEFFKGHALFEPDMEVEDNPGFFEYFRHWDAQANQEVPCVGDKCPFCAANDNPSTVALSLWNTDDDGLKVFRMNFSTTQDAADISEEEDGILGKHFRVKRLSDKGEYRLRPTTEKKLTKKQIAEFLKEAPDLPGLVDKAAKIQMERLAALDALEDDEDWDDEEEDEEEETKKTRGGKAKADADDDEDEDEDEDEDDEEDEDNDEDEDDEEEDSDDDDESEDEDEEESEEDEDEEISDAEYEVVKAYEKDEKFDLVDSNGEAFEMWVGEGVDPDYDEVKKGTKVTISAVKDDEGDWVISDLTAKKKRGRPKGSGKGKSKK